MTPTMEFDKSAWYLEDGHGKNSVPIRNKSHYVSMTEFSRPSYLTTFQ